MRWLIRLARSRQALLSCDAIYAEPDLAGVLRGRCSVGFVVMVLKSTSPHALLPRTLSNLSISRIRIHAILAYALPSAENPGRQQIGASHLGLASNISWCPSASCLVAEELR